MRQLRSSGSRRSPSADAGAGGAGGEASSVQIVRGAPDQEFWDLTVRGEGLDEYEGRIARVLLGQPAQPPERLGSGEAVIGGEPRSNASDEFSAGSDQSDCVALNTPLPEQ